jgi:predicted RNA binding protein YcfA (HicA-like mRNA interferase family)
VGSLPVLKPRQVVALPETHGIREACQRGSHKQFRHSDGRSTTVPFHVGRDISPSLLRKIAADVHLTVDEFLDPRGVRHPTSASTQTRLRRAG